MAMGGTEARGGERAAPGYFQGAIPAYLILSSFFLLTVPLCLLAEGDEMFFVRSPIGWGYVCALGMTHFVITLALYLQGANLRYFGSTRANRVTYFALPAVIFVAFDLYHALEVAVALPLLDVVVRGAIRLMDFHHFGRQNYGVLQLFRIRSGCRFPAWMRRAEDHYFTGLTLLLFVTFLSGGRFRPDRPAAVVVLAAVAGLLLRVLAGFAWALRRSPSRSDLLPPLAYLLLQTCSGALAAYSTTLYGFALAMHYVEYHVLMMPRCFHTPLESGDGVDRWFGRLRRRKLVFYGILLALAVPVTRFAWLGMSTMMRSLDASTTAPYRMLIAVFDGLFVFHYVIESRIWKIGDPYYRQSLFSLYFRPALTSRPATAEPGPPRLALLVEPGLVAAPAR